MRILYGLVIKSRPITIRLDNGGVIEVQKRPDLVRGTQVEINWDYTTNKPGKIWVKGKRPVIEEPVDEEEVEIDEKNLFDTLTTHRIKTTPHITINIEELEQEQDLHWPEM